MPIHLMLQLYLLMEKISCFSLYDSFAGGDDIKCAEYATFGTKELSKNIIKALEKEKHV